MTCICKLKSVQARAPIYQQKICPLAQYSLSYTVVNLLKEHSHTCLSPCWCITCKCWLKFVNVAQWCVKRCQQHPRHIMCGKAGWLYAHEREKLKCALCLSVLTLTVHCIVGAYSVQGIATSAY